MGEDSWTRVSCTNVSVYGRSIEPRRLTCFPSFQSEQPGRIVVSRRHLSPPRVSLSRPVSEGRGEGGRGLEGKEKVRAGRPLVLVGLRMHVTSYTRVVCCLFIFSPAPSCPPLLPPGTMPYIATPAVTHLIALLLSLKILRRDEPSAVLPYAHRLTCGQFLYVETEGTCLSRVRTTD